MAGKRQRSNGTWEFKFQRKSLLSRPVYFTFDTEAEGDAYAARVGRATTPPGRAPRGRHGAFDLQLGGRVGLGHESLPEAFYADQARRATGSGRRLGNAQRTDKFAK